MTCCISGNDHVVWVSVEAEIIADLAVVMTVPLAVTFAFVKFNQAVVLGYLVAGILVGPFTPPFSLVTSAREGLDHIAFVVVDLSNIQ